MAGREGSRRIELPSEEETLGWIATIVALGDPSRRRRREADAQYASAYRSLQKHYLPYAKRVAAKILWGQDQRGSAGREARGATMLPQMKMGEEGGVDQKAIDEWSSLAAEAAYAYALAHLDSFRGESKFSTWLNAITYHKTIDILRDRIGERQAAMEALVTGDTQAMSPEEIMEAAEPDIHQRAMEVADRDTAAQQIRKLDKALRALPVKQQEVIVLRQQEKSYAQMAEELGIPVGTVMSRLYHARKALEHLSGVGLAEAATDGGMEYVQRGKRRIRRNPGDDGVIYVEMEQDAYDLHDAGIITDKELRAILKQFNQLAEEGGGFSSMM